MIRTWPLLILIAFSCSLAQAETAEEKGLAIAREADRRDQGWGDSSTTMKMVLRNKQGDESVRELRSRNLEVKGDGDKSLVIFDTPRDVAGTAFLSHTHSIQPDDQWLYLPALRRVKRISSSNKSGSFMGSEFAYEDIASQEIDKYNYKYLQDETVDSHDCFKIERIPRYEYSGYSRELTWIDKEMYQAVKVEYYDTKGALLKTLTGHEYKKYLDKFWRPSRLEMVNHQTGKSTTLQWSNYKFKSGFTARDFDQNSLQAAR